MVLAHFSSFLISVSTRTYPMDGQFIYNISHKWLRPSQFLEKNLWKFWNGPLCRNKSGPSPLLNVAVYWQSSDTETCVTKLSQILANNIDNGGRGIGLRIYVRYCRFSVYFSFEFLIPILMSLHLEKTASTSRRLQVYWRVTTGAVLFERLYRQTKEIHNILCVTNLM